MRFKEKKDKGYSRLKKSYKRKQRKYLKALDSLPKQLWVVFGVPGSGKTTLATYYARKAIKKGLNVWSNVPITGTYKLDTREDIGKYNIQDGLVIIDEAGIEYNNREFKNNFTADALYWYKYHRHYNTQVIIFSQGYDDMDKKLRTLAQRLFVVKKSLIPFFIVSKRISKKVGVNELTKEICDEYYFVPLGFTLVFSPLTWRYFNTLSHKRLPYKEFELW